MTKEELKQIRALKKEIEMLQAEIKKLPVVFDVVVGSRLEIPYDLHTIQIEGVDNSKRARLYRRLGLKIDLLQDILYNMEDWLDSVPDSEMRTILRLRYRQGLSWQQIAFEVGKYEESYVRKKHNNFLKLSENSEKSNVI